MLDYLLDRYGPVMRTADVADVLHCHKSHVRAMCASGDLPAVRIGERWVIPTEKLTALIEGGDHDE